MTHDTPRVLTLPPIVTQNAVIPSDAYVEFETDMNGPSLVVFASATDSTPIIRIRVSAGPLDEQAVAGAALASAARRLHTELRDAAIRGGAL